MSRSPRTRARLVIRAALLLLACWAPWAGAQAPARDADRVESLANGALSAGQASSYATGVLLVFAVLGLMFWLSRWSQGRMGQGRGGLRVNACLPLGGKERLMVVQAEGERLLIGVAPGGVQLIRVLEAGEQTPESQGNWLARTLSREGAS